ncbi:hypothetical protein FDP41_013152 [Naegleria fowleri]|uniref:PX domain-containing protein n=1 Tax=Naegleria fowleri TaxID=5763 RepID=A0A6A5C5R1_NAEFO|nr:uncharacterized protein FDP41_013152 [Naegleria fowleri]KAF0980669.1 hypothetical protein FDP41_013152 [Naegleria fowleri]
MSSTASTTSYHDTSSAHSHNTTTASSSQQQQQPTTMRSRRFATKPTVIKLQQQQPSSHTSSPTLTPNESSNGDEEIHVVVSPSPVATIHNNNNNNISNGSVKSPTIDESPTTSGGSSNDHIRSNTITPTSATCTTLSTTFHWNHNIGSMASSAGETSPCLEFSPTTSNTTCSLNCFRIGVPYIVVSSNKVKYELVLCVRDRKNVPPLSCQKRYSDILKFHQRLSKIMKMSRELQNLFPSKIGFMVVSKNSASRKRKAAFEKYFELLVEEIFTQFSQSLSKEWIHQIITILLEELFEIQFIEDVLNTLRKPTTSGTTTSSDHVFKELESDVAKSLNLSLSLKQMTKGTVFAYLNPHTSRMYEQITENSSNCKINTISDMVQNQVNVLHVFCADRAKQEEFGIPVIANSTDGQDEDREIQNTEYQILKLNLNRHRDMRLSLDGILQSMVSAADVHITLKNYYLKLEFEELLFKDPILKQILEKGEKCKTEFLEDGLKQVFVHSIFDESSGNKSSFNDGDVQQVKKMLETLSALSKQAKELDMKYSILFTQLLKAVTSVDKQLIQKTVEQINLKSQTISSINEKLTEGLKYWYQFMDQKTSKVITEKEGFHHDLILVFLLPLCFSVVSYKISCVPQVLKLFFGLRCESVTTEIELMTENDFYTLGTTSNKEEEHASSVTALNSQATNSSSSPLSTTNSPSTPDNKKKQKKTGNDEEQLTLPKSLFGTNVIHAIKVMTLLCESQYSPFSYCVEFLKKLWNTIISESSKAVDDWRNVHYVLHEEERKLTRLFLSFEDDSAVDDFFNIQELTKQKLERVAMKLKLSSECFNISHNE